MQTLLTVAPSLTGLSGPSGRAALAALTQLSNMGVLAAEDRPWQDIPGVVLVGILMGLGFLIVAIRAMFRKK